MTNENIEKWGQFLTRLINERPNAIHNSVVSIAEACVDQMKDMMPGCKVRIIVEQADQDAHFEPEKIANGAGVILQTKVQLQTENDYLILDTETND